MACNYKYKNNWYSEEEVLNLLRKENSSFTTLYNNLIKELETSETGRKVFEQVKRDYKYKENRNRVGKLNPKSDYYFVFDSNNTIISEQFNTQKEAETELSKYDNIAYTLEEQQEEAIVTLLGMMAADKLDAKKDASLISKLKELWKQISDFVKSLLRQDGIKIDELPIDNSNELTQQELNKLLKNGEITKKCD